MKEAERKVLQFLDAVSRVRGGRGQTVGKLLEPVLFRSSMAALYSSSVEPFIMMIFGKMADTDELWPLLIRIVSLVETLAAENIVWLVPPQNPMDESVYYENVKGIRKGQIDDERLLSADAKMYLSGNARLIDGICTLPVVLELTGDTARQIVTVLSSNIYPTQLFNQYKKRGYKTSVDYSLSQAVRANRISVAVLIISILTAVLSPVISHKYVESTINSSQFKELCDTIHSVGNKPKVVQVCFPDEKKTN